MSEWLRLRIGDVCDIVKGETGLASGTPGQYPMVATGAERRSCNTYQFDTEAVCIPLVSSTGHGKKTLNYVHYQSGKFALGTILAAVIPKDPKVLTARYLHLYLSHFKDSVLVPLMKGAANVSLPMKGIASVDIPVPSVEQQQKLIDLIGRIESEHRELLEEGNRQASLFKQLRQAVLQEAVEGKLTADWRNVETQNLASLQGNQQHDAAALLAQIKTEKEGLVKARKINRRDARFCVSTAAPITDSDKPFELPDGWVWCRLRDVVESTEAGTSYLCKDGETYGSLWGVIKTSAITTGQFIESENKLFSEHIPTDCSKQIFLGDLLFCRASGSKGLAGRCCVVRKITKNLLLSDKSIRILPTTGVSKDFIEIHNKSKTGISYFETLSTQKSTSMNNVTRDDLLALPFPLPPLAEQQAIVARVDSLMATIDALEAQVTERKEQAQMLMQAVLREAFANQAI